MTRMQRSFKALSSFRVKSFSGLAFIALHNDLALYSRVLPGYSLEAKLGSLRILRPFEHSRFIVLHRLRKARRRRSRAVVSRPGLDSGRVDAIR
jgi:hypothetical protein